MGGRLLLAAAVASLPVVLGQLGNSDSWDGDPRSTPPGWADSSNSAIRLGGAFTLTGRDCARGFHGYLGAKAALADLHGELLFGHLLNTSNIILEAHDIGNTPPQAVATFSRLLRSPGLRCIVGSLDAASAAAVIPYVHAVNSTPFVSCGPRPLGLEAVASEPVVHMVASERMVLQAAADFISEFKWQELSVLTDGDQHGGLAAQYIRKLLSPDSEARVDVSTFRLRAERAGVRAQLAQVKASGRRVILLHASNGQAWAVLEEARELGMLGTGWVWITTQIWHPDLLQLVAELDGIVSVRQQIPALWRPDLAAGLSPDVLDQCPQLLSVDELFADAYYAYDAVIAILSAMHGTGISNGRLGSSGILRDRAISFDVFAPRPEHGVSIVNLWDGKFKPVGNWTPSKRLHLSEKVTWMDGRTNIPSDRELRHSTTEATYFTVLLLFMMLGFTVSHELHRNFFFYFPEPGVHMCAGFAATWAFRGACLALDTEYTSIEASILLNWERMFSLVLLPMITFNAGFTARKSLLARNAGPIFFYGVGGTMISTFVIGVSLVGLGRAGIVTRLSYPESFAFGALISSVDPAATMNMFTAFGVESNLRVQVLGESFVNTVMCIVLNRLSLHFVVARITWRSVMAQIIRFIFDCMGSAIVGVLIAMGASLLYKHAYFLTDHHAHGHTDEIHSDRDDEGISIDDEDIFAMFELIDTEHDDNITVEEVELLCEELDLNLTDVEIKDALSQMDADHDECVTKADFVTWWKSPHNNLAGSPRTADKIYDRLLEFHHMHRGFNSTSSASVGIFILFAYVCYELAESLHMSGIIAVLACGFTMGHYAYRNLHETAQRSVFQIVAMLYKLANSFIFFLIGQTLVVVFAKGDLTFAVCTILLCVVSRMMNIFGMSAVWNAYIGCSSKFNNESHRQPFRKQLMMVHSCLRGSISFWLALGFPSHHLPTIVSATAWTCLFTVFVFGGTTVPAMNCLHIKTGQLMWAADNKAERSRKTGPLRSLEKQFFIPLLTHADKEVGGDGLSEEQNSFELEMRRTISTESHSRSPVSLATSNDEIQEKTPKHDLLPEKRSKYKASQRRRHDAEMGGATFRVEYSRRQKSEQSRANLAKNGEVMDEALSIVRGDSSAADEPQHSEEDDSFVNPLAASSSATSPRDYDSEV